MLLKPKDLIEGYMVCRTYFDSAHFEWSKVDLLIWDISVSFTDTPVLVINMHVISPGMFNAIWWSPCCCVTPHPPSFPAVFTRTLYLWRKTCCTGSVQCDKYAGYLLYFSWSYEDTMYLSVRILWKGLKIFRQHINLFYQLLSPSWK